MDIRQMQYILALAEHRNFTKAAKALFISQPSLSAFVAKVEAELGVALFDRSSSPLSLTYAGEVYVRNAEQILNACDVMQKQLSDLSSQKIGRIRLGLPNERAAYMLPLLLPAYNALYPQVTVDVTTMNSAQMIDLLLANRLDIAILPNSRWSKEVMKSDIYSEELVIVGGKDVIRPEHLVDGIETAVDIAKLEEIPLITLSPRHGVRAFVDAFYSKHGLTPKIIIETTSNMTAFRLATSGMGAAILPRMTVELTRETLNTPIYSLSASGTNWEIVAAQRKDAYISQLERDFITVARKVFNAK